MILVQKQKGTCSWGGGGWGGKEEPAEAKRLRDVSWKVGGDLDPCCITNVVRNFLLERKDIFFHWERRKRDKVNPSHLKYNRKSKPHLIYAI